MTIEMKDDQQEQTESIENKYIRLIDKYSSVVDKYIELVTTHLEMRDFVDLLLDEMREIKSESKCDAPGNDDELLSIIAEKDLELTQKDNVIFKLRDMIDRCSRIGDDSCKGTPVNGVKKRWVVQSNATIATSDRLRFEAYEVKIGREDNIVVADGFEMHLNSKVFSIRECE